MRVKEERMAPSTPRPFWGWTTPVHVWGALAGGLAALALIVAGEAQKRSGSQRRDGRMTPAPQLIVDPNTVPPEVLGALPRMGPAMLRRVVAARDAEPFRSIDDLGTRVRGVGPATLSSLQPFLHFEATETAAATPGAEVGAGEAGDVSSSVSAAGDVPSAHRRRSS
jgi:hypothetical protein